VNERIKLLAEQCQLKSYGINGELLDVEFDEEKFAQLIVAECEAYVSDRFDSSEPWMRPGDLSRHFGVSEPLPRLETMLATNPLTPIPGVLTERSEGIEPNRNLFGKSFTVDSRNKK